MIERLAEICRSHLLTEKILVVPSLAIGHQIADAIAHSGTPWVNLRVETIRTLSDAVAGFELASEGVTVLSRAQALALIERACDRVLGTSSYFAALADRPGLHRAIQKAIDDLRHSGVAPSSLQGSMFEDPRKAADLARVLEAYEEELRARKLVDRFGVIARAISMLEGGAVRPGGRGAVWMVVDDVELTDAESRLLSLVTQDWHKGISGTASQGAAETAAPHGSFIFKKALGEENEIRGVFRSILAQRAQIDRAEIVYTTRDPYLSLAFELAAECGIPTTFAEGIPSHYTRPGQTALAFLRWIGEGWHAVELQRILRGRAGSVFRKAAIGWRRDRYLTRIDALIAERQTALDDEEDETRRGRIQRDLDEANEARTFAATLLHLTAPIADAIDVAAASRAAAQFLRTARVSNEIDLMAREALGRMFSELAAIESGGTSATRSEITARLAGAVRNLHVAASNPRPGHLHVAPVRSGAWSARTSLFVVGLDEDRHPGRGLQDPILLDMEREKIGVAITGDRPQRVAEQFRALLRRASSRAITLSWSSLRIRDRRESFPSVSLLEVFRDTTAGPDATYEDLIQSATEERFVDPQPLSASDWWLSRRFLDQETSLLDAIHAAYPPLDAGARAEEARDSSAITPYDGKIDAPASDLDPRLNGRTYSASQLERLAGCPFRYFVERILRIAPLEELTFDPERWLEPREFGSMVHELLEEMMNELGAAGRRASLGALPRMQELAAEVLERWRERIPPPSETAFRRREDDLLRTCEVFLRTEGQAGAGATPQHFEFSFDDFSLDLGLGRAIKLRGYIDRIDRVDGRHEWHVWDYKTGLVREFDGTWQLQCGAKMQHALYARAVEAKLGGRVTKSGYIFPTARGRGARITKPCTDDLLRALNLMSDVVGSGWFPHADECAYCDFQAVCGGLQKASERTRAKLAANESDPAVRAWNELRGIE